MNNKNAQIDTQIVQELFTLNLNISKTFEEVCQDILNKRNTDYCGAYELMKHDKLKSECFKISSITGQSGQTKIETDAAEGKKKKQGKLKSIQKIIDKNKEINEYLAQRNDPSSRNKNQSMKPLT